MDIAGDKPQQLKLRAETKIPSMMRLLQAIKSLIKLAYMSQTSLIPKRLSHINLFFQNII
jgi:hypothetical protein